MPTILEMDEYFNFDQATHHVPPTTSIDDPVAILAEADDLYPLQQHELPVLEQLPPLVPEAEHRTDSRKNLEKLTVKLYNNVEVPIQTHPDDANGTYPMFRAAEPCDLCRRMGLDCFLAQRGSMFFGCTCCISLYRECSFAQLGEKPRVGGLAILGKVTEDTPCTGDADMVEHREMKSTEPRPSRKIGSRLNREATKVLKQWISDHADHPYPTEHEKDELKRLTGLRRSQIANWLANARRRGKVRQPSASSSPVIGAIDIPRSGTPELGNMDPMQRWQISPPEFEAASASAIASAVAQAGNISPHECRPSRAGSRQSSRKSSTDGSLNSMFRAPSETSLDSHRSDSLASSLASSRSNRSRASFGSQDRRRRRRVPVKERKAAINKSKKDRIYQCTFCSDEFPHKYDWARHEKSLHLALERWTCCPIGGVVERAWVVQCVFCFMPNPTHEHLDGHNFSLCNEKTLAERTFYRKDHLRQHLKLLHDVKFDISMESWKTMTDEIKSECGFCPQHFTSWQQRVDHLAAHFKNGMDMAGWQGGWGFEPHVEKLVENSIPPYLIAQEKASMEPYHASRNPLSRRSSSGAGCDLTTGESADSSNDYTYMIMNDSNCWRRLERILSAWVMEQKSMGIIPTVEQLQEQSRIIIFHDNDPWNQTPADDLRWLNAFRRQYGILDDGNVLEPARTEDVQMLAPYVVKGGLRNPSKSNAMLLQTVNPFPNPLFSQPPPAWDESNLSFDPDHMRFDSLDLSTMDDLLFPVTDEVATSISDAVPAPMSQAELEALMAAVPNVGNAHTSNLALGYEELITDEDYNQLVRYMAPGS